MNRSTLIIPLLAIVFLTSCKKQQALSKSDTGEPSLKLKTLASAHLNTLSVSDMNVQDGRLTFQTTQAFQNLMETASADTTRSFIKNAISAIGRPKFISYADRIDDSGVTINSRDGNGRPVRGGTEADQDSLIDDPLFNQVVNAKGEIQVENTIYKVTPNGTFAVTLTAIDQLNGMLDAGGMLLSTYRGSLQTVDQENGYYKVNDNIYLTDTYGVIRTNRTLSGSTFNAASAAAPADARPCRPGMGCTIPPPPPVNSNDPFAGIDIYPYAPKKGFWGGLLQNIFGDPHYSYYRNSPDRRLKVNFSSKNWLVYASLGVRAVIQKKGFFGWGAVENKDEMRLGWTPLKFELDVPAFTMPGTNPPQDPYSVAGKMLAHSFKINFDGEYTTLRVSDILDADAAFSFLPPDIRSKVNDLSFDFNAFFNDQKESGINKLFEALKSKIGPNAPTKKLAIVNNKEIIIDGEVHVHNGSTGNGVMSKTFTWNTAIVGFSSKGSKSVFIFKPAKKVSLISGGVYAVGKLNGEWKGIAVKK